MNPVSNSNISKFITKMTKADAMAPIVALEATVTVGRTIQAYKRGGFDEARERGIEETTGAVVWLGGVKTLNHAGDKILGKVLKNPGVNFDVGTDKVLRTPFDNFMKTNAPKQFSKEKIALMKGAKVLCSVLLADMFIGLVVPKINQGITKKYLAQSKKKEQKVEIQDKFENTTNSSKNPSFKGSGFAAINTFTNAIENNNVGKLLSTDAGLVSGRMYSARSKEERREIAIRDIGSIYFYMWAQGHVGNVLNLITTGKADRLNPTTANLLHEHLISYLERNGNEINSEAFRKAVLGDASKVNLPQGIQFESAELSSMQKFMQKLGKTPKEPLQVAKVKDLENVIKDKNLMDRIREMAKLQPERMGEAVITKQQIIDSINKAEINDPKFLDKVFNEFTNGASKDKFKYVPNSKLYGLKSEMENYVETVCKSAKDGKINKKLLNKVKNKNVMYSGLNLLAGFVVAATFLSTLIPKFQYWYTKKTTGVDAFPGTYDFEANKKLN